MSNNGTHTSARRPTENLVTVADVRLEDAGRLVVWHLHGSFDPIPFEEAWRAEGLSSSLLPRLPGEATALKAAMNELAEHRTLIRPLDKHDGYKVVRERAKDDDLEYDTTGLTVRLDKLGRPVFSPPNHPSAVRVKALYEEFLLRVPRSGASSWLAGRIMPAVDAVGVKETGGVYYVPPHQVRTFEAMVKVIEAHTHHRVFPIPVVKAEKTVELVLDSLTAEVESECDALLHEINAATERAIESRVDKLNTMLAKVGRFEATLGTKLSRAREVMADADGALAAAALAAAPQMKGAV